MPHPDPRSPVTLEQLLRLKRAERPDAEFWAKFDAELRQKQLAALVERRSWWQELPHLFARRAYLPIGAAAVLTFTFVSVRYYAPNHVELGDVGFAAPAAPRATAPASPRAEPAPSEADYARDDAVVSSREVEPLAIDDRTAVAAVASAPLSDKLPPRVGELLPWNARLAEETPSARAVAANLARLEETEPELVQSLFGPRFADATYTVEDAAAHAVQMTALGGLAARRNRVLATLADRQFTQDPTAPEVVRERLARRLGDTEASGGWTRVGVKADRVSLKF